VIVLDISMPGRTGIDLIKDIHKIKPKIAVLVLSMHSEDKYGIRVIKAGAMGYLNKESAAEELLNAIEKVYNGQKYFSQSLMLKILDQLGDNSSIKPHEKLSDREYEVMILLASGKTVKEIGGVLFLSIPTISTYRSRILQKMEMKNNADLMLYAIKNKLVE
ncbi:MAG: response regulator transcription factor, partial [Ignavibacteriaceae bacterium]|nr:response regulator transcription factor [Ignavibacteriaceae bacterium]